jgi:hypothetical protein
MRRKLFIVLLLVAIFTPITYAYIYNPLLIVIGGTGSTSTNPYDAYTVDINTIVNDSITWDVTGIANDTKDFDISGDTITWA